MRTTLTLDDDVAASLQKLGRTRKQSFKSLVNDALRRGIGQMDAKPKRLKPFKVRPLSAGQCRLDNLDNIAEVLAYGEGEDFK